MSGALIRKARQVAADPVLRRWLRRRLAGLSPGEPPFTPHRPPYLEGWLPVPAESPRAAFAALPADRPRAPVTLRLPGADLTLAPGDEAAVFGRAFADTETLLGLHRFAWLPLQGEAVDPAWVAALWRAWRAAHGAAPDASWTWHPYTAAERAVNLLDFARRAGALPGPAADTVAVLAAHGPAIADRLEYFGDHHTSNHLANNGRGLFRIGLALGLERCAAVGGRILIAEAERIFARSGLLREGSSHYHILVTRNYVDAWLAARAAGRPETPALERIARRALAVLPLLVLPGGLPLVGDISPDGPPGFLAGLVAGAELGQGWTGTLSLSDRAAVQALRDGAEAADRDAARRDGWLRLDAGPWSGLWHAAPAGWSVMPGHGHQDVGAFTLHFEGEPIFVDPGRGAYGDTGAAARYRSAVVHNTVTVDGHDPYPPNKPYYDDAFRERIGGPPPGLTADDQGVRLVHRGFGRLGSVGAVERRWALEGERLVLTDRVEGRGRHRLERVLVTPLAAHCHGEGIELSGRGGRFMVRGEGHDGAPAVEPVTLWRAYGEGCPATALRFATDARLPWRGRLVVERV